MKSQWLSKLLICWFCAIMVGCAGVAVKHDTALGTAALKSDQKHLEDIAGSTAPLNKEQKEMIKDAIADMKAAQETIEQQAKDNKKLQEQAMANAKDAGAGGITKLFLGVVAAGIAVFGAIKIKSLFF